MLDKIRAYLQGNQKDIAMDAIKLHIKEWLESKKKSLPSEEMQQTYMLRRAYNSHIDNLITDLDCEGKNG